MRCPVDGAELVITDRSGVEIDYCPKCRGVWLDRGELDKLIAREVDAGAETYDDFDADTSLITGKGKNDQPPAHRKERPRERRRSREDYDDDERPYDDRTRKGRRKSFLSEIFDIFD